MLIDPWRFQVAVCVNCGLQRQSFAILRSGQWNLCEIGKLMAPCSTLRWNRLAQDRLTLALIRHADPGQKSTMTYLVVGTHRNKSRRGIFSED